MANPYRAVRQLERQIFRSVPERPEPMWQRDGNNAVPDRLTGRSLVADRRSLVSLEGAQLIATTIYQPSARKVKVVRVVDVERQTVKPPKRELITAKPAISKRIDTKSAMRASVGSIPKRRRVKA